MPHRQKLLIIDDEPNIRYSLETVLTSDTLNVQTAATARQGIEMVQQLKPAVVLLDIRLPDMSGLEAFDRIYDLDPRIPVIMMTAFSKTATAIEAISRGAFEYLVKPVDFTVLEEVVNRALHISRLNHVPALLPTSELANSQESDHIIGNSVAMQAVYKAVGRVAQQDVTVLLLGESGTGKELVARAIFHYSHRNQKPFLAVNCAALTESLLESELFGHEKGAFTGADSRHIGKFEQVNGGTIFLDEVGDMSASTQAKALRLLQEQQFERVGGTTTIQTNVRIIAATNKNLFAMVQAGEFREDLFYRLNGFTIHLPALRERHEDILALVDYFVRVVGSELERPIQQVSERARQQLQQYNWPGNVRELFSAIRFAVVNSSGGVITEDCLPTSCRPKSAEDASLDTAVSTHAHGDEADLRLLVRRLLGTNSCDVYREVIHLVDALIIDEALKHSGGNQQVAAERLGISRPTLRSKLRAAREDSVQD